MTSETVVVEGPGAKDPERVKVTVILKRLPEARPLSKAISAMLRFVDRIEGWQPEGEPKVEAATPLD